MNQDLEKVLNQVVNLLITIEKKISRLDYVARNWINI